VPELLGVAHVDLTVRNPRGSARWYTEVLGLTVLEELDDNGHTMVLLQHPPSRLTICLGSHPRSPRDLFDERRTGLDHLSFLVASRSELVEWQERLEALGVEHTPIQDVQYGAVLVFRDPDNIQLELFARPG
jgi:catechol 2,3-dioxygenase-like lactoylglutathione lyase family enzyme